MSLIGRQLVNIDAKNRAVMPVNFRSQLPNNLLITFEPHFKQPMIFTEPSWKRYQEDIKKIFWDENNTLNKKQYKNWYRLFLSMTADLAIDDRGLFLIPQYIAEHAALGSKCMLVGYRDRLAMEAI